MERQSSDVRTFIAIEIPAGVRTALARAQEPLAAHAALLKIVDPRLLHLTVRFLGPVPSARLGAVERATQRATGGAAQFSLHVDGVGTFPVRGRPRVIWAGLRPDPGLAALQRLFTALEQALVAEGFLRESRGLSAHLTLARVRPDLAPDATRALEGALTRLRDQGTPRGSFMVSRLTVMRSDLSPTGPRYTPLGYAPLRAGQEGAS